MVTHGPSTAASSVFQKKILHLEASATTHEAKNRACLQHRRILAPLPEPGLLPGIGWVKDTPKTKIWIQKAQIKASMAMHFLH